MRQPAAGKANMILTVVDGAGRERIGASAGQCVLDVLRQQGMYINAPCGGHGTCGKCRISVLEGTLRLAAAEGQVSGVVGTEKEILACRAVLAEDCTIDISGLKEQGFVGTTDFIASGNETADAGLQTVRFVSETGTWNSGHSVTDEICSGLARTLTFSPKALRQLSKWMGAALQDDFLGPGQERPIFLTVLENKVLLVRTAETSPVYGIGVDIGTTTVALALVDLGTGEVKRTLSLLNSQRQFGADVISRIQKGTEGYSEELRLCICSDICRGINELCGEGKDAVVRMVVAGNTTMMHLLQGMRGDSLALSPFNPVTTALAEISAAELFGTFPVECEVTLLPSVGAYIGADIVAGMLSCEIDQARGISLFIDVGTNGEMAIGCGERIICVSTAAGPAFEGANIVWGIGSIPGAISAFDLKNGERTFSTIEGAPPVGICGSAVVDIVAACLREKIIDPTGFFPGYETSGGGLPITQTPSGEWIRFTQKDVREFQLAKSAIRSGIELLLREYGCKWEQVEHVFLAGGFGTRMNVRNAVEVGLFPRELQRKIQPVGNSALGGTVKYMISRKRREAVNTLVHSMTVIDLSQRSDFNDLFMEQLMFEARKNEEDENV